MTTRTAHTDHPAGSRRETARGWTARTVPIVPPIYQAVTYELDGQSYEDIQQRGGLEETWYSRFGNPTVDAAAEVIRRLERAEDTLLTSSGMAAIATTLLSLCHSGRRIVAGTQLYGDTWDLMTRDLPALGMTVDHVDGTDLDAWRDAFAAGPAAVAYAEALSNPQLGLLDVAAVAELAHDAGALLVVDNTFCSPYLIRPLDFGADVVIESATKYLNGHSDLTAGSVSGRRETIDEVRRRVVTYGGCLDPHAAYLLWRGLQTFEVRVARQHSTAAQLARALDERLDVLRVIYPGFASHPQRALAVRQFREGAGGAMVSFVVDGGDQRALRVMRGLSVATEATSLGGVETLISAPFNSSHFSLSPEERESIGILPGMLRLSTGVEDLELLWQDLARALDRA